MSYFTSKEILAGVYDAAFKRSNSPVSKTIVLSFLAGAYIAFGGLLSISIAGGMPEIAAQNPGLQKLAMGAVFPMGLMLVVIAGADLFTGNTAYFIPPVASGKISVKAMFKNWGIVYLGNFIGSVFVAWALAYHTGIFQSEPWLGFLHGIADYKTSATFTSVFAKGIGANWLVTLAVWTAFAARDIPGKIMAIWFPIMAFVAMGFEHSVANMFYIPAAIFHGADITWGEFITSNLIPATLGNIVGGSFFTGTLYWFVYDKE
ncbi:formate/nitrite transporter family protein [Alkalitalea saponilacus]|uniref:Formate/nitrite transporter n=1 Tax=Alkalitalea saponilacus TaxID=889453 RepID=A0A1T5HTV8_9BACT|nr:formate/nitrite transporter family protein [Alkalitalea saponilacus]ASB49193.1 formate transporter [Alkalitalea saponilacus]SKC23981.1 formate/nitrite transporter [Alkalitalea saponilacus]